MVDDLMRTVPLSSILATILQHDKTFARTKIRAMTGKANACVILKKIYKEEIESLVHPV